MQEVLYKMGNYFLDIQYMHIKSNQPVVFYILKSLVYGVNLTTPLYYPFNKKNYFKLTYFLLLPASGLFRFKKKPKHANTVKPEKDDPTREGSLCRYNVVLIVLNGQSTSW